MTRHVLAATTLVATLLIVPAFAAGDAATPAPESDGMPANCPMHAQHMAERAAKAKADTASAGAGAMTHDHAAMNARGDQGMGFSQTATTHHFMLTAAGGEIRVEANDPADTTSRDLIRGHLVEIARSFAAGDFAIPMFVHATTPPGVPTLERLRGAVDYRYGDLAHGGRVEIQTASPEALTAVHQFLRFQIEEHKTGDPETPAS